MRRCGCNPISEPFEFEIGCKSQITKSSFSKELFPLVKDLGELKNKIICEYHRIIDNLECGIHPDLEFLLEEISLVEVMEYEQ